MSGRSVVPILEKDGDVYVTGSTVVSHRVTPNGECDVFPADHDVQLVLSTRSLYKLRARLPPHATDVSLVWRESIGVIRAVVPLFRHASGAWAAARGEQGSAASCHGFAIEYFSPHKPAKPPARYTALMRYMRAERCKCVGNVFSDVRLTTTGGAAGGLRVREYHVGLNRRQTISGNNGNSVNSVNSGNSGNSGNNARAHGVAGLEATGSAFLEQDWCHALCVARINYWHERLENGLIEEPEIFQFQTFAMEFADGKKASPLLCQLVLSTERLYIVPRYDAKLLSSELPLHHQDMRRRWFTVAALRTVRLDEARGIMMCSGSQRDPQTQQDGEVVTVKVGFFDLDEATEMVLEIQRVWEFTHRDDSFPHVTADANSADW